ncbi:MAG: iron-containing alcohol dehydrogenase [Caloramator sp.]|nr:iron-containing alcohol dehydrogenase [Caloramator sp.]
MWESKMPIYDVREIRCKTTVYLGVGAIKKIFDICEELKKQGIDKVAVLTGKGAYEKTGAWKYVVEAFDKNSIKYVLYNKVTPNPTVDQVDEAVKLAKELGAKAVIGIGGGSPIDAAKSAAILLEYPDKTCRDLYEFKFIPTKAVPIVAINLTHGTGTEADRFAVVSIPEKEYKPAIAYDCIYPLYSIDDPSLMTMLPANQTLYVSVDAINHIIEAATTKAATPYSILLAKETFRLITKYLPQALMHPQDLTARYYLLYASLIAGISFDNGLLHFTHALEHPLSAVKPDLAHGLGLGMLLPAVIKHIYPACSEVLADILNPIAPKLTGVAGEAECVAKAMENWLKQVGLVEKLNNLGFKESDVEKLSELALNTPSLDLLLSMAPIPATKETIKQIYKDSL